MDTRRFGVGEPGAATTEQARSALLLELEHGLEAQRALNEAKSRLRGEPTFSSFSQVEAPGSLGQVAELRRFLEQELQAGRIELTFEPFPNIFHEHEFTLPELPPLGPAATATQEASFIAIRLVDPKNVAVAGRPFQIELPDGSVKRGLTDPDGFGRVSGFTQDGTAKIVFPGFDEVDFKTKNPTARVVVPVTDQPGQDPFAGLKSPSAAASPAQAQEAKKDGPTKPKPEVGTFELIALDDVGIPVPGIDVLFSTATGEKTGVTNADGAARVENTLGPVKATLFNMEKLREVLRPRLKGPREPRPFDDKSAVVRPLSERFDPVPLKVGVPVPVLLTPAIECHEIPGANFDFGRSYVRSTAIEQLADIAQALRDTTDVQAMIFGHTDLSGSEALNKELSERRAKAVHALLTHDSSAWEQLFSGTADGANWQEKWDMEETQNMLNALGCTDDEGAPLEETGKRDEPTKQAIRRFQRGEFPSRPLEQPVQAENDFLGKDGRRLLFLAYAKRISRQPIAPDRFLPINGAPFMGCGEFNALSVSAKDAASRRVNVFLFDPVTAPDQLPCKLRQLPPCRANLDPKPTAVGENGRAPFRCRVFQEIAAKCASAPSPDQSHDLVLSFPLQMQSANQLAHKYTLEADDGTITIERTLADDARANDDTFVELAFEHLPENHRYRLTCNDGDILPYTVFDFATLAELQQKFKRDSIADDLNLPADFAQSATAPAEPVTDEDGSNLREDGTNPDDDVADESSPEPTSADELPAGTVTKGGDVS